MPARQKREMPRAHEPVNDRDDVNPAPSRRRDSRRACRRSRSRARGVGIERPARVLFARAREGRDEEQRKLCDLDTYTPGPCSANGSKHGGCPAGELVRIHVVTVAYELRPWHITFLPGGTDMLVTELPGNLRIVRGGKLDPTPIAGWPAERLDAAA